MEIYSEKINDFIDRNGIFISKNQDKISYPDKGNDSCFAIEENSFWFKHRNNCILESVKNHASRELFFDIGGGNGYVSAFLKNNGVETVLVEPGKQGALNAKKRNINYIS